jgi:serine/threonine-protein kinase
LEFEPERRYQTPSDMLVDLKLAIKRVKAAKEGGRGAIQELASKEGHDSQGQPRKLMIVESNMKVQDRLRDLFRQHGYRVLVSSDPERTLARFFADSRTADLVLFTTINNGRAALDIFNRLGQESSTRELPAVLLLDQNHHEWAELAHVADHRQVAKMPIKMRELREMLRDVTSKKVS